MTIKNHRSINNTKKTPDQKIQNLNLYNQFSDSLIQTSKNLTRIGGFKYQNNYN